MKKIYTFLTALLICQMASAQPFVGDVTVTSKTLAEQGDTLRLELLIKVNEQAINKCQSWTVIPVLGTEHYTYSHSFPEILLNGNNKRQMYERKAKFENIRQLRSRPYVVMNVDRETNTRIVNYGMSIPYEPWMDSAALSVHQILTSCAGRQQLFVVEIGAKVELESREPYQVHPQLALMMPPRGVKTRKVQGQAFLDFRVGRTEIIPDFRRNAEELAKIQYSVDQVRNDTDVQITGLFIEGYASPEGSYSLNERLSRERAFALRDYMVKNFNLAERLFTVDYVPEDWDGLRLLVEESNLSSKDQILDIINSTDDYDVKEARIKRVAGGAPYRTMLNEMFPQLRRVDYRIDFTVKDFTVREAQDLIHTKPEMLGPQEFFTLAESQADSTERDRILEMALRYHDDDRATVNNAATVMIRRGELEAARRYLEQGTEHAETLNNLGVIYLIQGDLDRAEALFRQARQVGSAEATHNLEEVELKREDNIKMERYSQR